MAEVYSPARMIRGAQRIGLIPTAWALDLAEVDEEGRPHDFDDPRQRKIVEDKLLKGQPVLLILSPMCTAFSSW